MPASMREEIVPPTAAAVEVVMPTEDEDVAIVETRLRARLTAEVESCWG